MAQALRLFALAVAVILMPIVSYRPETGHIDRKTDQLDEKDILERLPALMDSYFIQNIGQIESKEIMFYSSNGNIFFTPRGMTFRFKEQEPIWDEMKYNEKFRDKFGEPILTYNEWGVVLNYTFLDANEIVPVGRDRCSWNNNYFKGNDSERWYTDIPNYRKLYYPNVWDGLDIVFSINNENIQYDMVVHNSADLSRIGLKIEGHEGLRINENGNLVIRTKYGEIVNENVDRNLIESLNLEEEGHDIIRYSNSFTSRHRLINETNRIMLYSFSYSTLIGSDAFDIVTGLSKDLNGNIFITGQTVDSTLDWPRTPGAYQTQKSSDIFITKFRYDLSALMYSALLGGTGGNWASDLTVDSNGNVFVVGNTFSMDFPVTNRAYDMTLGENDLSKIFVTGLNKTGSSLIFSTFIGGRHYDCASGIALDETTGNVYVTGHTGVGQEGYYVDPLFYYPTTANVYDKTLNGGWDIFISVLNSLGSNLIYSTYIGGSGDDFSTDIFLDEEKNVLITGYTFDSKTDYPTTEGAYCKTHSGVEDAFVSKLNTNLSTLICSTLIGSDKIDESNGIALDHEGNIFIAGGTHGDFPVTKDAYDSVRNGYTDVFITKFDPQLSCLVYSTFIGGSNDDIAYGIVVNDNGNAIITGNTKITSINYPTTLGAYDNTLEREDVILSVISKNGSSLLYSTYIGGDGYDVGREIILEEGFNLTIAGTTQSSQPWEQYPTTEGAFCRNFTGHTDVFITKLELIVDEESPVFVRDNSDPFGTTGEEYMFNVTVSDDQKLIEVKVFYRFGNQSFRILLMEYSGNYTASVYVPTYEQLPISYYFYAKDHGWNINTTPIQTVDVLDNDAPIFIKDHSTLYGTTGEPIMFSVSVKDNIEMSGVRVEYWGAGDHLISNMSETGPDRYSVTVNVPEDTVTLNYIFHAVDTSGNRNSIGKRSFDIKDNDAPYFGPDTTSNIGYTGNVFSFISDARDNIGIFDVSIEYWFGKGYRYNESMKGIGPYIFNVTVPEDSLDPLFYRYSVVDVNGLWNNTGTKEVRIEDDDPPVFGRETFSDLLTTGDEFEIEVVVKDNMGVQGVYLEYWFGSGERTNASMKGFGPYLTKVQVPKSTEGPFNYVFHAFDGAGNWGRTDVRTRTVNDNDGPIFGIDNTDKDCTTGDPFTFRTGVSDNIDVKELFVEYWFGTGRHSNLSMTGTDGYVCSITIPPSPSLTLWYKFTAVDGEGNWAESIEKKTTVIDDDAPEMGTDQTPSSVNTGEKLQFKVTASDNIGIVEAFIEYQYGDGPETKAKMSGLGYYTAVRTYTYDIMVPVNSLEPIQYTIVLSDQAGNKVEKMGTVTIIDSIPPTAEAGTDVVVKRGTIVVLNGSASSDNIGITNWTWSFLDHTGLVTLEGKLVEYSFRKVGTYTINLTIKDSAGNIGSDTITVKVERIDEGKIPLKRFMVLFILLIVAIPLMTVIILFFNRKKKEKEKEKGLVEPPHSSDGINRP